MKKSRGQQLWEVSNEELHLDDTEDGDWSKASEELKKEGVA